MSQYNFIHTSLSSSSKLNFSQTKRKEKHFVMLLFYILVINQNLNTLNGIRQIEKVDESYRKFLEKLLDEKFYNRRIRPFYSDNPSNVI